MTTQHPLSDAAIEALATPVMTCRPRAVRPLSAAAIDALATLHNHAGQPLVYIASAYTSHSKDVRAVRAGHASYVAGLLFASGIMAYTPIGHGHALEAASGPAVARLTHSAWMAHCAAVLTHCSALYVVAPHWSDDPEANAKSAGLQAEIAFAHACEIPIIHGSALTSHIAQSWQETLEADADRIRAALKTNNNKPNESGDYRHTRRTGMNTKTRQGDVLLVSVALMPDGCKEEPREESRVVLMHGEVTGHAHAIYDHDAGGADAFARAEEKAEAAIARAKVMLCPAGERYLVVTGEPVYLRHEEHTAHKLPAGIYHLPRQVEYTPAALRNVTD